MQSYACTFDICDGTYATAGSAQTSQKLAKHDSMHQDLEDILGFEEVVVSDRESKQFPELVE